MKLKKTRRNQQKYPGLNPRLTTRIRQEFHDFDYIEKLSDNDKSFLNKFIEEELNTKFKNDGTDFNQTKEDRKKIYDRNNHANRDVLGILKNKANRSNNKRLVNYDNVVGDLESNSDLNPMHLENAYAEFIEFKEIESFLEEYDQAMADFSEASESPEPLP